MEYFLIKQHEGIKKNVNITFDFFDKKEIWKKCNIKRYES